MIIIIQFIITFPFIFVCSLLDRLFLADRLSSACEAGLGDSFFLSLVAHCRRFTVNFDLPFLSLLLLI